MNLVGLFWGAFAMFFVFQSTFAGSIWVVNQFEGTPPPPWGYLRLKFFRMSSLQTDLACKLSHLNYLRAKYLFCYSYTLSRVDGTEV
jgi:hypothetical protein